MRSPIDGISSPFSRVLGAQRAGGGGPPFDPLTLFETADDLGGLYDPRLASTLWTDTGETSAAALDDAVASMVAAGGPAPSAVQTVVADRPARQAKGLLFDGQSDNLRSPNFLSSDRSGNHFYMFGTGFVANAVNRSLVFRVRKNSGRELFLFLGVSNTDPANIVASARTSTAGASIWSASVPLILDTAATVVICGENQTVDPEIYVNGEPLLKDVTPNDQGTATALGADGVSIGNRGDNSSGFAFPGLIGPVFLRERPAIHTANEITNLVQFFEEWRASV